MPLLPVADFTTAGAPAVRRARPTDIRVVEVQHRFQEFTYRAPYQFGGRTVDRVTILDVDCRVRTGDGKHAWGFGSMTLGNAWAFPAASQEAGLGAMTALAAELRAQTAACDDSGHPIDLFRVLEPAYLRAAEAVSRARSLTTPIPKLCTLVVASAFDAAIHDAYGKAFGVSVYDTYGPRFMRADLSADLGPPFAGEYLDRYVPSAPRPTTLLFHSVGASDPLEASDVRSRIDDGLPNTLEEWIARDGLRAFKMKLNGGNLDADFERIVRIDRVVTRVQAARGMPDWKYLLDFNEGCPNVQYLLELLERVRRRDAARLRARPLHRAAHGTRPPEGSGQRHARRRAIAPGRHRRVAHGPRDAVAGARDGIHRRRAQGVQRPDPRDADGGRRAEVRHVPVRSGPHLPGRLADSFGRHRRARAR